MTPSRNSKCPCGSGKKHKHCCLKGDVEFRENEVGTIRRSVPLSDDVTDQLKEHMDELSQDLGRELRPDDELFPNTHMEHVEHGIAEAMKASGVDPAIIYAFEQTGLIVSEDNLELISNDDREKWQAAIDEYRSGNPTPPNTLPPGLTIDPSVCWSCNKPITPEALRCQHCEAKVEDAPKPEDAAMLMDMLQNIDPSVMKQMQELAEQCETGEEFVNMLMVGPCPSCESDDTGNCEEDPEIDDPCVGRCYACSQLFCTDCDEPFKNAAEAVTHDCPQWEGVDEFDEDIPY